MKINQLPGLSALGRKDRLWLGYARLQERFPQQFTFLPRTFILPEQQAEVEQELRETGRPMIVKPPNYYCGIGIKMVSKPEQIPSRRGRLVVQRYIDQPFLIRGLKFDLRVYVLLTSTAPLRMFVYEEGLVRFATAPYTNDPAQLDNLMVHLTNYSVNKGSSEFVHSEVAGGWEGHKWNLQALWAYMESELGLDWRPVWRAVQDLCVRE